MGTVGVQGRSREKMTETDSQLFVRPMQQIQIIFLDYMFYLRLWEYGSY